jgi:tetratricopeptide (TPR) repeat protein
VAKSRHTGHGRRTGAAQARTPTSATAPSRRAPVTAAAALALILAGTAVYSNSFRGVFVWDDVTSIVENPHIRSVWPLTWSMSAGPDVGLSGRPVASLTLAFNYAMAPPDAREVMKPGPEGAPGGLSERFYRNVWGYHALNLAIHLLAALTLFGVVRRSLAVGRLRERFGGASTVLAFLVALIWLVHPLHTESVTYVVQRVESLMGLCYLFTVYCAIRAAGDGPRRGWWASASVITCALGMGVKEVMVTAPVTVWLWDRVVGTGPRPGRRWPLYAGLASTWIVLAAAVASGVRPHSVGFTLGGWTWWSYLLTQTGVVMHYLRLAVVPTPLVFDYAWPQVSSLASVAPEASGLLVLAVATSVALVKRRPIGFVGAWVFGILVPTSTILPIPTEVAAEHRMYLPAAALVALGVLGAYWTGRRLLARMPRADLWERRAAVGGLLVAGLVATAFGGLTHARNRDYWSAEALMRDTVQKRPTNVRARISYGVEMLTARRFPEAEEQLRVAIGLDAGAATKAQAHMYLGSALCAQGQLAEGVPHLERALALDATLVEANGLLGEAYAGQGRFAVAAKYLRLAVQGSPDNPLLLRRAAWLLATAPEDEARDGVRALEMATRAVDLTAGNDAVALEALGAAYAEMGRFDEAVGSLRRASDVASAGGLRAFVPQLRQELAQCAAGRKLRETPR